MKILWGDEALIKNGTPNRRICNDGLEALQVAGQLLREGQRVTKITSSSGEMWPEAKIRELFGLPQISD